jgi:hypothetical protein
MKIKKNYLNNFKKGITPIIVIILMLFLIVLSIISFQNWYQSYQSKILNDFEQEDSLNKINTNIDRIIDSKLYFKNGFKNLTILNISIDGKNCDVSSKYYSKGLNEIDIGNCSKKSVSSTPEILVITNKGIFSKKIFLNDNYKKNTKLNCSNLNGGEWLFVPGNSILGTSDFCVMKYEAKNVGGIPTSQPSLNPWVNINQTEARIKCSSLGDGYHLITNAEWVTIAREAENNPTNWANGIIGSVISSGGGLYRGNVNLNNVISCGSGIVLDGNIPGTNCLVGTRNKRTLNISGNLIWDLSGNVWEWLNDTFNSNIESSLGKSESRYYEWSEISGYDELKPSNSTYDANYGIGRVYVDIDDANPSGSIHALARGSSWGGYSYAGAFTLNLILSPSSKGVNYGFRCTYTQK